MRQYDSEARCPKCRCANVTTRYIRFTPGRERMQRTCEKCLHTWDELPMDNKGDSK